LAKFSATSTLTTSTITDTGTLVNIPGTTTLATTAGFVGIATSTPYGTEKLTVYGNIWGSGNIILQKGSYNITLTPTSTLTANRTITFPDLSGTVAVSSTAPITLSSTGVIGLTTPLAISYGGTATSSIGSAGSVVYSNGTTYAFTSVGNAGQPLLSGGSGAPTWGTLSVSFGGTGLTSVASGALLYGSGGTTLNTLAIGSAGYILASNGTAPYWASLSSLSIATGTGAANYIAKWTGANTLATSTITDNGSLVLVSNQFQATATTTLATASGNVGIGTTTPTYKLDVNGNLRASLSLTAGINVENLTGDKTLTPGVDKMFQFLNPNGVNRIVYLATTTANAGDKFIIKNDGPYSTSTYLIIQQGSTVLDSIYARSIREYIFDGTNWVSGDVGTGISGSDYNVAIGYNANGYSSGAAVGYYANGYSYGAAMGSYANGYSYGAAVGYYVYGYSYGAAVGSYAYGHSYGAAVGSYAYGHSYGAAMGYNAQGYSYGAAVGAYAKGMRYGAALGYLAGYYIDTSADRYNVLVGAYSGYRLTTGIGNIIIGYGAGYDSTYSPTTGSYNILIGYNAWTPATTTSNFLNIGGLIFGTGLSTTANTISSGKVGIRTINPLAQLDIQAPDATHGLYVNLATTSSSYYGLNVASLGNSILYVRADGNVGIGTTEPSAKFHVLSTTEQLRLGYDTSNAVKFTVGSTNALTITPLVNNTSGFNFTNAAGTSILNIDTSNQRVGIGTSSPAYLLDVYGGAITIRLGATASSTVLVGGGSGKITSGTLDPIYNIGGVKYATYIPGMTGIKEETAGVIKVDQKPEGKDYYQAEIDFNNLEEGSDLWLFSKVTNLKKNIDKLTVLLTPASRAKVWYQVDPEKFKLYFFAEKPTTISYRLTAPRFDWEKWKNVPEDAENIQGLVVNEDGLVVSSSTVYQYSEENNEEGILEKVVSLIKDALEKLGLIIENGIAQIKEIITEKLSAKVVVTNQLCLGQTCIDEAKLKELLERSGTMGTTNNQTTNNGATSNGTASNATTSSEQQTMGNEQSGNEQSNSEQLSNLNGAGSDSAQTLAPNQ
jgi:hypothetical protein